MGKRLATVPAALEMYHERMKNRDEASYQENPTVSLTTARSYWASRMPYCQAHDDPTHLTDFMINMLDEAAGGKGGPHTDADISRMQEVLRYSSGSDAKGSS